MNKFKDKIIVSDIDGTFLDSKGKIVQRNVDAIEYFKANGGLFTFATGRVEMGLHHIVPIAKDIVNAPAILCNGSYIYDLNLDKKMYEITLDAIYTRDILKQVEKQFPNVSIRISYEKGFLTPKINDTIYKDLKDYFSVVTEAPFDSMTLNGWNKVVLCATDEELGEVRAFIIEKCGDYFAYSKSCKTLLELLNSKATKGKMLYGLKDYYKKQNKDITIYAIGDYENDIDMLMKADISACPLNALQAVQDICDIKVCTNNDGAIAGLIEYIERNIMDTPTSF